MSRNEREEEAFQSMFDSIKGQSIHAAPVGADGAPAVAVATPEPVIGPDGKPVVAVVAPVVHALLAGRDREFDDTEQKIVQGRLWLISFTDLFSIILCFFLLIYSTRDPDLSKISAMTGSGATAQHGGTGDKGEAGGDQEGAAIARVEYGEALNLDYLQGVLKTALNQVHLQDDVDITAARDHLRLEIDDPFATDDSLDADGTRIAKGLADRLNNLSNRLTIVAHGSDWAQVVARSRAFADVMDDAGYRKPFTVVGEVTGGPDIEIRVEADDGRAR